MKTPLTRCQKAQRRGLSFVFSWNPFPALSKLGSWQLLLITCVLPAIVDRQESPQNPFPTFFCSEFDLRLGSQFCVSQGLIQILDSAIMLGY